MRSATTNLASILPQEEPSRIADSQLKLLQKGLRQRLSLSRCLHEAGLQIDDLRYAVHSEPAPPSVPVRLASLPRPPRLTIPAVSFFSGAGGLDLGFESAGFKHLALFEHNPIFCATLRKNRPAWPVIGPPDYTGDVANFEEVCAILEDRFSIQPPFPGVFTGGPPCQPFSIAANQRFRKAGENFKRVGFSHKQNGMLLFQFGALIRHFLPNAFLVENVTGLADVDGGQQLAIFREKMTRAGYRVHSPLRLRAEKFGVPQVRERLFIVGFLDGKEWTPPSPPTQYVPCSTVLTPDVEQFQNHEIREHKIESIIRYRRLGFGKRDALGRVDRLDPRLPSKTVIAGGLAGGGRSHLHPWIPRTLSVRECARLQTFPDNYVFTGPMARQFTQVGNAVPPILARALAKSLRASLLKTSA